MIYKNKKISREKKINEILFFLKMSEKAGNIAG